MMKLILLISGIFIVFLWSDDKKIYLSYVNEILSYNFKIDLKNIKSPFRIYTKHKINKINTKMILLDIFDNEARMKIIKGSKSNIVWVKKGDKIGKCVVEDITLDKVILRCGKRFKVKSVDKVNIFIKEEK